MGDHSNSVPPATGYPATGYPRPPPYSHSSAAGTAYPYGAPPPRTAYYQQPYPSPRATFLRRLFAILVATLIIAGTIVFIIWIVLRPRLPHFQVDSVTLSNFNLSSSSLITGNWDVRFTVRNPNHKLSLYYDNIDAFIYYKGESLAETTLPPFVQGKKNQTAMRATFAASSAYVDKWVVDDINGDKAKGASVSFNARMLARIRYKSGLWARRRFWRIYCGELPVSLSANGTGGTLVGGTKECRVGF
ncbi:unnamed protein product [Thlaspi arvense]|uniref:Late embryogenesis abundant protein LEA-2 subgroup domain-containing protein n=1 Tax=Thlaspi arvense TaxID=13288 RepID=A0AAU9RSS7_THLAR|nr:unnamed protein product [Thlaspi arvense]